MAVEQQSVDQYNCGMPISNTKWNHFVLGSLILTKYFHLWMGWTHASSEWILKYDRYIFPLAFCCLSFISCVQMKAAYDDRNEPMRSDVDLHLTRS